MWPTNLVKLRQMRCIQCFISENPIDAEHFCRFKSLQRNRIKQWFLIQLLCMPNFTRSLLHISICRSIAQFQSNYQQLLLVWMSLVLRRIIWTQAGSNLKACPATTVPIYHQNEAKGSGEISFRVEGLQARTRYVWVTEKSGTTDNCTTVSVHNPPPLKGINI